MKTLKIIITLAIIICMIQTINSQNITTDTILANKHFETAKEYYKNKSYDTAIVYFEKASILYEKNEQWRNYLLSETKHGECYQRQWQLDNAIVTIKPAIEKALLHINENDTIVADAYNTLGFQYVYQAKFDSTLLYWKKALQIRKKIFGEKHIETAKIYNSIGIVYNNKKEFDLALEYHFKSLQIRKELLGEKHPGVAMSYYNIGIIYADKSEYDLALEYYLKDLQIIKEFFGEKHSYVAQSYNSIGNVYLSKKEFDLALEYHFKSLKIKKELFGEKHIDVAVSYNNIGAVYVDKSEYDLALEYYLKFLQIAKELLGEKHPDVAASYNNIGIVYADKSEYDLALEYYFKSFKIYKEQLGEKQIGVADNYCSIGNVYKNKSEYDLALEYYFKSLKIYKELIGEKHTSVAMIYNNIGNVFKNKNKYDSALKYYQKATVSSLRNFNDTINVNSVPLIKEYLNWNELLFALKTKAEIFANHSETLSGFKTLTESGSKKLAFRHYQACDTLISQVRKNMKTKSDKIALGSIANEVYKGAVDVCLNLTGNPSDRSKRSDGYDYNKLAFYFSEKNKSSVLLESLAGAEAQKFAGIPDTLLQLEHKLQIDIALYKKILAEEPDSTKEIRFQNKLFKANRTYDSLIIVFEQKYPKYYELKYHQKPADVTDIQQILDKHTAMLSYFVGDSTISIFTVTKKKFDVVQVEKPKDFNDIITELRENISNTDIITEDYSNKTHSSVDIYKKNAYELYQLLFPQEVKKNLNRKIKNLIIIPDSKLAIIPFESLLTEKYNSSWTDWNNTAYFSEMPYLIKNYNISYSYSANLFYETNPKTNEKPQFQNINDWLALAPVFDNDSISGTSLRTRKLIEKNSVDKTGKINTRAWLRNGTYISPLPGSEKETKNIFKIFEENNKKAELKTRKFANEEFAKSGVLKNYRYLHIATHGMVNEEKPELSCILLAQDTTSTEDNILYSGEIYNLELNADLTVLSACETGLGKIAEGEGVIGLTRALLYAGSKNIIVSLWQVSDESTNQLMVDFYKNIFKDKGDGFAQHLSKTKLKLINEGKYAHPFFWSPFVLIGR